MRRPVSVRLVWLGLLAALGFAIGAEAGAPPLNETHRDKTHKFSLKYFRDWQPVPLQPGETVTVCKFADPKASGQARGTSDPKIEVLRILKGDKTDDVVTGAPAMDPRRGRPAEDVWEAAFQRYQRPMRPGEKPPTLDRDDFEEIESKDKPRIQGKLWTYEIDVPTWSGQKASIFLMLAAFEKDDVEYGVFMSCGGKLRKSYEKPFKRIAKSFKFFDDRAGDVESLDVLDGVNITAKRRSQIERNLVDGWDVIVSPKKNYIVVYNTMNNRNRDLAKEIAKRIEKIREQIYEVQFPPAKPIDVVSIVRVCGDAREYHAYGGPGGSAGYWSSGTQELVFYDASRSKKIDDATVSVLYHEAFHQYIFYSVGDVAPHSWFNEGHGDYYAGAEYKSGKFKIKPFRWRTGIIRNATAAGPRTFEDVETEDGQKRRKWSNKGYTPLEDFVTFTQREYYSYPGVSYAQGWSFIYFLREIVPKKKKWREKWGHILEVYFDTLKAEVNAVAPLVPFVPEDDEEPADGDEEPAPENGDPQDPDDGKDGDGKDGDGKSGEEEEELDDETGGIPRTFFRGRGGPAALKKAIEKAFEGVDFEELEKAWLESPAG